MSEPTNHGVVQEALGTAPMTPVIGLEDAALQHRMLVVDLLAGDRQAEPVEPAEAVEIRGRESSVEQVEVFQTDGVGTSIIGRPRPSTPHRRAANYTLICEEPRNPEVTGALALLPMRQRETVVLRYYLDLSVEETARTMRCSVGTVKSQTAKALVSLRGHLEDQNRTKVREI